MIKTILPLFLLLAFFACENISNTSSEAVATELPDLNPAAAGFDADNSDQRAIEIVDSVVLAHGGRRAYDQNRFFKWNFFGVRTLTWDKEEQRVRIDFPARKAVYLLNHEDMSGRVQLEGSEITHPDSLNKYLTQAKSMWINDSYWLVHQFKLKDSGVTLKYVGETEADPKANRPSYIIDQTFAAIGDTPDNKYRLYVDQENFHINTWQFFRDATDEEPSMETPWVGYADHNGVLLSADRSGRFQLQDVSTPAAIDDAVFEEF